MQPPDSAAVFGAALSLWQAFRKEVEGKPQLNLSECYNGMDQFMREVMRVANLFEAWACKYIAFEELTENWPYFLEDKFGETCLEVVMLDGLMDFDEDDCLRAALRLRLPIRSNSSFHLPIDIKADNPLVGSAFCAFRIQTAREELEGGCSKPFTPDDDPFDAEMDKPYFQLYGVGSDGTLEHIANRGSYEEAISLAEKLAPGVEFPPVSALPARRVS